MTTKKDDDENDDEKTKNRIIRTIAQWWCCEVHRPSTRKKERLQAHFYDDDGYDYATTATSFRHDFVEYGGVCQTAWSSSGPGHNLYGSLSEGSYERCLSVDQR
jgi:hypothetical protein